MTRKRNQAFADPERPSITSGRAQAFNRTHYAERRSGAKADQNGQIERDISMPVMRSICGAAMADGTLTGTLSEGAIRLARAVAGT